MFKCEIEKYKEILGNNKYLRIKDRHGHFLGKVENGLLYVYCKRCKEFHRLQDLLKRNYQSETDYGSKISRICNP